jgi:2-haloacid dehalogenase
MEKIITFDCYGTLLDTSSLYNFIGNIAENHNLSKEKAIEIFSSYEDRLMYGEEFITYDKLLFEILTYCNLELNTDIFTLRYNEIIEIHKNFLPFPDVMEVLHKLKDNGYKLIILSNSTKEIMKWHLEKLENIFDDILVAEDTRCYKPNLKFFKIAEEKFNLKAKEHYHIAKGYWWDIVPATKMGWNKIWINRNRLLKGRENEKPYAMVYSLSELLNLIN